MRRNPLYVFDDLGSTGVFNVPLNSTVQVNDIDGMDQPVIVQINSKDNMGPNTTIAEFLVLEDNYTKPGTAGFIAKDEKGQPDGVAPLDSTGQIPGNYIPEITIGNIFVVDSEQEMIDLVTQQGDLCVRTDVPKTFIDNGGTTGTISDWTELGFNIGGVQTVNGQTGTVILDGDDIDSGVTNKWFTQSEFDTYFAGKSIDNLVDVNTVGPTPQSSDVLTWDGNAWRPSPVQYPVTMVAGKTGNVLLDTDDIAEATQMFFTNTRADDRIQTAIDDTAGVTDTTALWSADKIFNELSYKDTVDNVDLKLDLKLDVLNPIGKGFFELKENSSNVLTLRVKRTTANDSTVIEPGSVVLYDVNDVKYSIKTDAANAELNFKVNEVTALSIRDGVAPTTPHAPINTNDLVRKDYVDTSLNVKADLGIIADIVNITDPTLATAEDNANKINELLDALRASGLMV